MSNFPNRLTVCMHEAGHAIVQLADHPAPWIDWIAVEGVGQEIRGLVQTESLWQPSYMEGRADPATRDQWSVLAWRDIIFYLAGPIAELRWRRHSRLAIGFGADQMAGRCLGDDPPGADTDLGRVRRRLNSAVEGDDHANFVKAWLEAEERVAARWSEIRQLGRLLDEKGRLEDEELLIIWRRMKEDRRPSRIARIWF